ncbi:MAG: ribbon-helix-helix protein, CopG family [Solirubrobacterales bacterium]
MPGVAMTLRLTDEEQRALRTRAEAEGASMQEVARRAIRDYVARTAHRDRVAGAATRILDVHAEAIDRLGR